MKNQKYKRLENYCENRVKMAVRNFSMALKMSPLKKEKALNNDWKCFKFLFYVLQKNLSWKHNSNSVRLTNTVLGCAYTRKVCIHDL